MALVTLVGFPSSGKSTRAQELSAFLAAKLALPSTPPAIARLKTVVINDESLGLDKSSYDDSRAEKPARATLFSAVVRALNKETIVIVDAMNYIKGSRYQMYCAARESSVRTCTVFIATPPAKCAEWNATRPSTSSYIEPTLENLISRFEEPSSAARWDSPLITVPSFDGSLAVAPEGAAEGISGSADAERIWEAITTGDVKPPNVATLPVHTSTTSYLTLLESTTSLLITTLLSQQALSPLSGTTTLVLPTTPAVKVQLNIYKPVSMPMLQRLKRQFSKLNQQAQTELTQEQIARLFAEYLEAG
ncbi:chromatin associated protein KTI12 [Leucosporidium creatinivorum]|uniref:Chromatin associated protein KTI12 n=1 Tax=Leucosporidium creatinivorum TaxID=106004 RepID=A0A1Y2FYB5_9BASI|nr:chromatin associated protein KTI12 [Leucosporidium creatinivorum]